MFHSITTLCYGIKVDGIKADKSSGFILPKPINIAALALDIICAFGLLLLAFWTTSIGVPMEYKLFFLGASSVYLIWDLFTLLGITKCGARTN